VAGFTPAAQQQLLDWPWPGNVRELAHTVERALLLSRGEVIGEDDLRLRPAAQRVESAPAATGSSAGVPEMTLAEAERWFIERALEKSAGNVNRAAEQLGLSRSALYRRLRTGGEGE
jgi:DNA-binding NtrC family response regulator